MKHKPKPRRDRAGAITGTLARIATTNREKVHSPAKRHYSRKGRSGPAKALRDNLAEGLHGLIHPHCKLNSNKETTHEQFQGRPARPHPS